MVKVITLLLALVTSCGQAGEKSTLVMEADDKNFEYATLGGGCFWCTEAVFLEIRGVDSIVSGYSGGHIKNPSYREVTTGRTGHAEVIRIKFNPDVVSFRQILEVFFHLHDPTTLNRQGADVGTQYRSVIFYHDEEQQQIAREVFKEIDESDLWNDPLVTEITPMKEFYAAELYHQNYYARNADQPYCTYVISPKMQKLRTLFKDQLIESD